MRTRATLATIVSCLSCSVLLGACASKSPPPVKSAPAAAALAAAPPANPAEAPVKLLSLAEARPTELAAVSVTSLDRLLTNGATLVARAVPLPIEPAGLRDMLLAQAGLAPEVSANLDLGAPSGAAVVATGAVGATGAVMAVAARGPAEAARVIAALGKQIGKRGDVVLVDNGSGGRGWILRDGNIIVFSDDVEALARGARLAEEARHAVAEDVTAVVYPEAIARANGTDVKTAVAGLVALAQAAQASQGKPASPEGLEMMSDFLSLAADADAIEVGLSIDPTKGLSLRSRWRAHAGSRLAALAREVHPFELDTAVLANAPAATPAFVASSSLGGFMRSVLAHQRERLVASKSKAALAYFDAYLEGSAGETSFAGWFSPTAPLFAAQFVYPMKDAAAATKLQDAVGHLDKAALAALVDAQVGAAVPLDLTVKKQSLGKLKAVRLAMTFHKDGPIPAELVKKIFGGALEAYFASVGPRVVGTVGKAAKADLPRLATATPAAPTGPLADALATSKGRDSFFYFDVASIFPLVASIAQWDDFGGKQAGKHHERNPVSAKLAAFANAGTAPIPLVVTAGGDGAGKLWSGDLTIPAVAFTNAGGVVKAVMAASMGGGAADAPPAKSEKTHDKKHAHKK
jgi:hypothetical protein